MASASDHRAHAALQPADCLVLLPQRLPAAVETSIGPAHYPAECTQSDAFLQPSLRARKGRANSNSFSSELAVTRRPSAVTTSTANTLSQASPCLPFSQPYPPPRVRPAIPVSDATPRVVARPNVCVFPSNSPSRKPGSAPAVRPLASIWIPFIGERSIIRPFSHTARPAAL